MMRKLTFPCFVAAVLFLSSLSGWSQQNRPAIRLTNDGRYLEYTDGKPFFWLGDTAWELFHRLTLEEIKQYLSNRKSKGFNVIQAVILAELDGIRVPNRYGHLPLIANDPRNPNDAYFRLIDTVVAIAAQMDIIMALLPSWGDKFTLKYGGTGPVLFDSSAAFNFGSYLGKRYAKFTNIVWILGGDRPPKDATDDWIPVYAAMAKGIDSGSGTITLKSFHPGGFIWETAPMLHNEPWLHFNMIQSGHSEKDQPVWKAIVRDWALQPAKPTFDGEPCYEDHPVNPWKGWDASKGYFRAYEVRKQLYRSVFSGAMGVTYGHHAIWQFYSPLFQPVNYPDRYWNEALDRPGAFQAGYLKALLLSRPSLHRLPDQSIIKQGQGLTNAEYIAAFRDKAGSFAMIYMPVGKRIEVNLTTLKAKKIHAWWFDPQTGKTEKAGSFTAEKSCWVESPVTGPGKDWVLLLDDAAKGYQRPRIQ